MKFTFEAIQPSYGDVAEAKVRMEFEADAWPAALEQFQFFLLGCGFVLDGRLDLVEPEPEFES